MAGPTLPSIFDGRDRDDSQHIRRIKLDDVESNIRMVKMRRATTSFFHKVPTR